MTKSRLEWRIDESEETTDYWGAFIASRPDAPEHPLFKARVKADGCVELVRIYNSGLPSEDENQMHLCNLAQTANLISALNEIAKTSIPAYDPILDNAT